MINTEKTLFELSSAIGIGNIRDASDKAYEILSEYCEALKTDTLTVIGEMKGESDYTVMLDAHIDEVGFVVTAVDDNGFLTVSTVGGIDLRSLPARRVTVHGKEKVTAVFCATPPHLAKGEKEYGDISEIKLDSLLGEKAREIISVGDFATFSQTPARLLGDKVSGKSFDDRAGVVCLLLVAEKLKGKKLPFNVAFLFSDAEELGTRGAKTASFKITPNEAIAVDVSFGNAPDIKEDECGKLGKGAMIGISPTLDKRISSSLIKIAEDEKIPYQLEVMSGRTGTNADVISKSKSGVKTGLISIPLRNMHTDTEVLSLCDIEAVSDLIAEYILSGGCKNA